MLCELLHSVFQAFASDVPHGVFHHLLWVDEYEAEDVPVNLLLDRVEVEVPLLGQALKAVRIHDYGQELVNEAYSEHVPVRLRALVQELDRVFVEVDGIPPDHGTLYQGRFPLSPT